MDTRELLEQYRRLYDAGLISEEEYQRQLGRVKAAARTQVLEEQGVAAIFHLEPGIGGRILSSQVFSPTLALVVAAVSYLVLVGAVVVAKHWEGDSAAFLNERVL
jgi:uncharacterized membrane protein